MAAFLYVFTGDSVSATVLLFEPAHITLDTRPCDSSCNQKMVQAWERGYNTNTMQCEYCSGILMEKGMKYEIHYVCVNTRYVIHWL